MPLVGFSQSKTIGNSDTIQKNLEEKLRAFSAANDFFFATLDENFEGESKGENIRRLMQIFSKPIEEPEDFFRLQINAKKFEELNSTLELVYDDYFPFHIYIYEKDSEFNNVRGNINSNKLRDIITDTIPINGPYTARNSFIEGHFKKSFAVQLLTNKTDSKVKSELQPLLDFFFKYSAISFSIDLSKRYNAEQFDEIYDIEYNRILTSLVFWEYLADCANYDLNTRKYFYED